MDGVPAPRRCRIEWRTPSAACAARVAEPLHVARLQLDAFPNARHVEVEEAFPVTVAAFGPAPR